MRIKYKKGITPERIAEHFVNYVRENNLVIGAVNIYIQTYDEEMKPEAFTRGDNYLICEPLDAAKEEYAADVVEVRRRRMKVVG